MKRITYYLLWTLAIAVLIAVLVIVNLPDEAPPTGTEVGELLPDFRMTCVNGSEFQLSAQRGKVVVINFWATWCAPCVEELPNFDRLLRERASEVAVLAVHSLPVTADVSAYLEDFSYTLPFAVDDSGSVSELLGASTVLPETIIVSPEGVVTAHQTGALTFDTLLALVNDAQR